MKTIYSARPFWAAKLATDSLEVPMLREIAAITSGERSALDSFENAKRMREAAEQYESLGSRGLRTPAFCPAYRDGTRCS